MCLLHQAKARKKTGFSLTLSVGQSAVMSVVSFKVPESHRFYGFEKFFKRRRRNTEMQQLIKQLIKGTI